MDNKMNQIFNQDILDNSTFKWQNLAGKELLIRVGTTPDELINGCLKINTQACGTNLDEQMLRLQTSLPNNTMALHKAI